MKSVLIADDSADFRLVYRDILLREKWPKDSIYEATTGLETIEKVAAHKPSCILLDYNLPDMNAIEVIQQLKGKRSEAPCAIVVATGHGSETIAVACMKSGAVDYLVKDDLEQTDLASLLEDAIEQFKLNSSIQHKLEMLESSLEKKNIALQEIMNLIETEKSKVLKTAFANIENILLPMFYELKAELPASKTKMAQHFEETLRDLSPSLALSLTKNNSKLTPREIQICNLVNKGLPSKDIAEQLDIAIETIAKHRYRIRRKLGLSKKSDRLSVYLHSLDKS